MVKITNICTEPDKIQIRYNAGRIIGYLYYGPTCYRMLLVHILDKNNRVIPDNFRITAINPSIY